MGTLRLRILDTLQARFTTYIRSEFRVTLYDETVGRRCATSVQARGGRLLRKVFFLLVLKL